MFDSRFPAARWAMISLAALILGIGACTTPTTSEVDVGQRLHFELPAAESAKARMHGAIEDMNSLIRTLQEYPGVEDVDLAISEEESGPTVIEILVWGEGLIGDRIGEFLKERHPILGSTLVETEPLHGEVRESLAEKVGRSVFQLRVSGDTEEEIRRQFLDQLREQGFTGDAVVRVEKDGDRALFEIQMSDSKEGNEFEDVVEIRTEGEVGELEIGGEDGEVQTTISEDGKTVTKSVEAEKEQ